MLNVDMQAATMALAGIGGLILLLLLVYIVILHKKIRKLETNYTFFMQDETEPASKRSCVTMSISCTTCRGRLT